MPALKASNLLTAGRRKWTIARPLAFFTLALSQGVLAIEPPPPASGAFAAAALILRYDQAIYTFFLGCLLLLPVLLGRRRHLAAAFVATIAALWILYYHSVASWIASVGSDSLLEAGSFNGREAWFFLRTLRQVFIPENDLTSLTGYLLAGLVVLGLVSAARARLRSSTRRVDAVLTGTAVALLGFALHSTFRNTIDLYLDNSDQFSRIRQNFSQPVPALAATERPLQLVVYIGESTSAMNLGIYGYPRATTPLLQALKARDDKLLVFDHVFSTHTHTSPSLLEALSIGIDPREDTLPIEERQRLSLIELLTRNGVPVRLLSNQGSSGSWNQAASIIFRTAHRTFSVDSRLLGNKETVVPRPPDDVYFGEHLPTALQAYSGSKPEVLFLHSYAGHGPYLDSIPLTYRVPVDDMVSARSPAVVFGRRTIPGDLLDDYDAAMRYVDFAVHSALEAVASSSQPAVFLYFADHGESAYTYRGHESSRFLHEMARVPFLLYFNTAARTRYADLYEQYRARSNGGRIATLAQLPATLLDLLGFYPADATPGLAAMPVIGAPADTPPIVVRRTAAGITEVNLDKPVSEKALQRDHSDATTRFYRAAHRLMADGQTVCYHRTNTIGSAVRGRLVANCLEIDLVAGELGQLAVFHPPATDAGLRLHEILYIAQQNGLSLWIDSKNLVSHQRCQALQKGLAATPIAGEKVLIEFPPAAPNAGAELSACTRALQERGFRTSYYVPTEALVHCAQNIRLLAEPERSESCTTLQLKLQQALDSGLFTDFSFDYRGVSAMKMLRGTGKLRWNTWHVRPEQAHELGAENFGMVILRNADPNWR